MRLVGYLWALPVTAVGLALAALAVATGGGARLQAPPSPLANSGVGKCRASEDAG